MPKKKVAKKAAPKAPASTGRIVLRTGEALVEGGLDYCAAEPEVVIGELDGPVGFAIANQMGDQTKGHTKVFAILNCDVQVRPVTVMVSKVTVSSSKYTNILMGTVQAAIAHGVLDAVRAGDIPKAKANDLGIIVSVWLDPSVVEAETVDHEQLFNNHRAAIAKAIGKAMKNEPGIDWLLKNQNNVQHFYHQLGVEGKL
ncbi:MAG TPA: formaldehyde-activating enzyme [Planctomycetaceae bacterium]|jgi:formaldehyde-activating enzyme|nr:formaldehyde-activating enzyme [Planctomycetaceae bacterium]